MPPHPDKPAPLQLLTVLLLHDAPAGAHYDWMVCDPRAPGDPLAKLWTVRVAAPSSEWAKLGVWDAQPLPFHRRDYLQYEGPLSGNRGGVTRVDEGWAAARLFSRKRIEWEVSMRHFTGRLEMTLEAAARWRVRVFGGG